jgi:hypothetical protein
MTLSPLTLDEVVRALSIEPSFVLELEREAIVTSHQGRYAVHTVERIRVCWCLHHDLGVNLAGIEVALNLLEKLDDERRWRREALQALRRRR